VTEILEVLRHTPNLVECTFQYHLVDKERTSTEKLVLPGLRRLYFERPEPGNDYYNAYGEGDGSLLTYLTLPALETLVLSNLEISHVLSFLVRSSPPLQELLLLGMDNDEVTFTQLNECLRLSSSLTHFQFHQAKTALLDNLLAALAQSPSTFLPNLCIIKIHLRDCNYEDFVLMGPPSYDVLLWALLTRRSRIGCFELLLQGTVGESDYGAPEPEIRAVLRRLVADGMDIYIGDTGGEFGRNFLEGEDSDWDEGEDVDEDEDEYDSYEGW